MVLYSVAGLATAFVALVLGAGLAVVLVSSMLVPPSIHLLILIARYRGLL
jgi:hypothetical protein